MRLYNNLFTSYYSIRKNLDPEEKFSDEILLRILRDGGLNDDKHVFELDEKASELSEGQNQLLSLCQNLLR